MLGQVFWWLKSVGLGLEQSQCVHWDRVSRHAHGQVSPQQPEPAENSAFSVLFGWNHVEWDS